MWFACPCLAPVQPPTCFTSLAAGLDPGRKPLPAAFICLFLRGALQVLATRSQVLVRPIYSVLFDGNTNAMCSQYRPWAPPAAEPDQVRPLPGYSCMLGPAARVVSVESHGSWRGRMRSRPEWQVHTSPHILTVQPATLLQQPHAWPRGWASSFVQYTARVLTKSGHRRTELSVAGAHDILHAASAETPDIYCSAV